VSRIATARLERLRVPLRTPLRTAERTWRERRLGLVVLVDEAGREGLGELPLDESWAGAARAAVERRLLGLPGRDPAEAVAAVAAVERTPPSAGPDEVPERAAAGAIVAAALDLVARAAGRSLAAELAALTGVDFAGGEMGGSDRSGWSVEVNGLVGAGSVEDAVQAARDAVAAGFGCLKLKVVRGEPVAALVERVGAVRATVGPGVRLRLDANGTWTEAEAIERLRALAGLDLEYVEQPVAAALGPTGLARVRRASPVQIAADESVTDLEAAARLLAVGAADVLVVKPSRVGGPLAAARLARVAAAAHGVATVISTMFESGVGLAAASQVAAALSGPARAHGLATADLLVSDLLIDGPRVVGGRLAIPAGSGLGVVLDLAAVERFRVR
jgi:L-alanine-DL-glutamate epimerase-like enolase superfamily enzyme